MDKSITLSKANKLEKSLPEFRQVKFLESGSAIPYYKIQQNWAIATGDSYFLGHKESPINPTDFHLGISFSGYESNKSLSSISLKWQPTTTEWRFLPEINEKDV